MRFSNQRRGVRRRSGLRRALELVLGLGIAVGGVWLLRESPAHWKLMHEVWDAVEGKITASAISNSGSSDVWSNLRRRSHHTVLLDYRYRVGNEELTGTRMPAPRQPPDLQRNNRAEAERIAASYKPGAPITVYHNPRAPRQSRLTEKASADLFGVTLACGSLMLLGGAGLVWLNCREFIH
jgi:hypothetical protein